MEVAYSRDTERLRENDQHDRETNFEGVDPDSRSRGGSRL